MATFASCSTRLAERARALDPAWRWAVGIALGGRLAYTLWSLVILWLVPFTVQNLDLFGNPVVAAFDLRTSERQVYARAVNGDILTFKAAERGQIADTQTGSVWRLADGTAVSGTYAGQTLSRAAFSTEDVLPYRGTVPSGFPWLDVWQRFDTNWYLKIAERGYAPDDGSMAFFPLYPILMRGAALVTGNELSAGLLVSTLALTGVLYLLFRITRENADDDAARRALVLLALFPSAVFLFAAYTEALFILLAMLAFYLAKQGRCAPAVLCGACAAAARAQGALLILPLAYLWWQSVPQPRRLRVVLSTRALWLPGIALVLVPLPALVFVLLGRGALMTALASQWDARLALPTETLAVSIRLLASGGASWIDASNLVVTLLFAAMLVPVWRRLPREYFVYTAALFAWTLFRLTPNQPLVSMWRYVLPLFPVFMLWGIAAKNPWLQRLLVYPFFVLNLYFSAQFFMWGWVA